MRRDYRLYELGDDEFENLVAQICTRWLGQGVTPFATGKDGGRDAKFHGKAICFSSTTAPLEGHCVLQAKHVAAPNKSCSDRDFSRLLKNEHPKVKAFVNEKICDHYLVFTNRKLTGGADKELIAVLMKLGVVSAHIIGLERLNLALDEHADIREMLPNRDPVPFHFEPDDIIEVISALHAFTSHDDSSFNSAQDFERVKVSDQKNKVNGLTDEYYREIIVNGSMPHFHRIEAFLKNPRNREFTTLYHDAADELKQKILVNRERFRTFDAVFAFLSSHIQRPRTALRGKRRLVNILLHYMYFNCEIGSKHAHETDGGADAHA
jgi:hypothetical protein